MKINRKVYYASKLIRIVSFPVESFTLGMKLCETELKRSKNIILCQKQALIFSSDS